MLRLAQTLAALTVFAAATSGAQSPTSRLYPVDSIGTECVELESYPVTIEIDECSVVDFGLLTTVDGAEFFYARYLITADVPSWPDLREFLPDANALVLFAGRDASEYVRVYRSYHEDISAFARFSFPMPAVIETSQGTVLNVMRRGAGGGMHQWFNDEYWLWRWGDWQRLDVTSWYDDIDSYVPSGYSVGGVSPAHFDLVDLSAVSPVRKPDDPQCCPSAGVVTVSFEWIDLALAIRDVAYDPDTDFRELSR